MRPVQNYRHSSSVPCDLEEAAVLRSALRDGIPSDAVFVFFSPLLKSRVTVQHEFERSALLSAWLGKGVQEPLALCGAPFRGRCFCARFKSLVSLPYA